MSFAPLPLTELAAAFRQRSEIMARYAPEAAKAFEDCAEWLDASLGADLEKPLTLTQAVRESNWSYEGLRRRLKEEPSLNVGGNGAPMVRRCDLPRLGAPRGPRGKYRARKPKATAAKESASLDQEACSTATIPPKAMASPAVADNAEDPRAPATTSGDPGSGMSIAAETFGDAPAPEVVETERRGATAARRARPMRGNDRRHYSKARFDEILALAAQG